MLTPKEENKLRAAERKVFRKILGLTQSGSWRNRKNQELENIASETIVVEKFVRKAPLIWTSRKDARS